MSDIFENTVPGGGVCPECGSTDTGGYAPVVTGAEAWIEAECDACGAHWRDEYAPDDPGLSESENCPECGAHFSVILENEGVAASQMSVDASCDECGARWQETYSYAHSEWV